tara:strand:+ start:1110 stop:1319 length:210 start_codon:yes stop_codon:yes gene_type:complete
MKKILYTSLNLGILIANIYISIKLTTENNLLTRSIDKQNSEWVEKINKDITFVNESNQVILEEIKKLNK